MIEVIRRTPEQIAGETYLSVWESLNDGQHGMRRLALHIPYVLGYGTDKIEHWRRREIPNGRAPLLIELDKPEDYFIKKPREGLGLESLYFLDGAMKLLGKNGSDALICLRKSIPDWDDRIEKEAGKRIEAKETKQGNPTGRNQYHSKQQTGNFPISSQSARAESNGVSDRTQRKLDRLAKDRPDLLQRVKAKELSVQAAAIEAGIIKPLSVLDAVKRNIEKLSSVDLLALKIWINQ